MHFTIITPCFNQLDYLKRCMASMRDQVVANSHQPIANRPISVHHHVQDGGSRDGTREFLAAYEAESWKLFKITDSNAPRPVPSAYTFSCESMPDQGMYDAIDKGVAFAGDRQQAQGTREDGSRSVDSKSSNYKLPTPNLRDSVIAWLNCDEQYLPGTLQKVAVFFDANPDVDIVFGSMLMVDEKGELLACRKAMPMRRLFLEASYLYNFSCAMFFRASIWQQLGGFDTTFKNAGDEDLIRRALTLGAKTAVLDEYLSTFTYSDTNLSSDPDALAEHERLKMESTVVGRALKVPLNILRLGEKFIRRGHMQRGPLEYEIYAGNKIQRTTFRCESPSCRWPDEKNPYLLSHRLK